MLKKSHFYVNRRQRNGIFSLLGILFLTVIANFSVEYWKSHNAFDKESYKNEFAVKYQAKVDSLKILLKRKKDTIYPFNPNYLDQNKAYYLGLNLNEIDRVLDYRKKGKYFNSAKEFKIVSGISDSIFEILKPSIKIPKRNTFFKNDYPKKTISKKEPVQKIDLNKATANDLIKVYGIGKVFSVRIIKYRDLITGFVSIKQLYDVYGLDSLVVDRIANDFEIKTKPSKLKINEASEYDISKLPYIGKFMAKKIVSYRDDVGKIKDSKELLLIHKFPKDKLYLIELYLEF